MRNLVVLQFLLLAFIGACGDAETTSQSASTVMAFADRFEYGGESYQSLAELRAALESRNSETGLPPVSLSTCIDQERAAALMNLMAELGATDILISAFSEECQ